MTASGINHTFGERTEFDPQRQVAKAALPQSVASQLHREGRTSRDVYGIDDDAWASITRSAPVTRDDVVDIMRVYESYKPI